MKGGMMSPTLTLHLVSRVDPGSTLGMRSSRRKNKSLKFILFVLLLCLIHLPTKAEQLTVVTGQWPPFIDETAANRGFWSEIVTRAFEKAGIQTTLKFLPWKRVEFQIDHHNQVSFAWIRTEEREKKWLFSDQFIVGRMIAISRSDQPISWQTYHDLKPFRIGLTAGYSSGEAFDQFKTQLKVDEAPTDEMSLTMLLLKRVDLIVMNPPVAATLIRTKFQPEQRKHFHFILEPPISVNPNYIVCAKTYPKCQYYLKQFNKGLKVITQAGIRQRIIDQSLSLE